ncbi:MAG: hypothetical protein WDZ83_01635 [Rhizobiaceae bacterium]
MKVRIEFYRTRDADDAHAVIGSETADAQDLDDAIRIARQFSLTLDMPQRADAVTITGADGATIYSGALQAGS